MPPFSSLPSKHCLAPVNPSKLFQLLTSTVLLPLAFYPAFFILPVFWYFYQDCFSLISRQNNFHSICFSLLSEAFLVYWCNFCLPWLLGVINTSPECFRGKGIKYIHILRCCIVISFVILHVLYFIICIAGSSLLNP